MKAADPKLIAYEFLSGNPANRSLRDVQKAVEYEKFKKRVEKYSFNMPILKVFGVLAALVVVFFLSKNND